MVIAIGTLAAEEKPSLGTRGGSVLDTAAKVDIPPFLQDSPLLSVRTALSSARVCFEDSRQGRISF